MADGRLSVLIALADRRRAEELAAHLGESEGMIAVLADEVEAGALADGSVDAMVTDEAARRSEVPTVLLAEAADTDAARAILRPGAADPLIAAAIRLTVAGYAVSAGEERPAAGEARRDEPELMPTASLTQREKQVIALLAEGASNKLIARRLDISVHTAKFHVAAILEKLGAVNRTDAIAIAMREGLVLV
jgi:DNA-binding NarL/FixJ family response regulator